MWRNRTMPHKEKGVALIVVMLIVAMIAIIATEITSRNQLAMRRTLNLAEYDQAYWYAMSAEQLLKKVLKQDLDDSEGRVHLQQYWALNDVMFPAEHGEISGKVMDLSSCFNLNALSQASTKGSRGQPKMPLATMQFKSLLVALGMDDFSAEKLSQHVKDYLDADSVNSPFGAEDAEYESRTIPYRAANTLMNDKSELRSVLGVTQEIYKKIAPYICVIPGNDKQLLNVNTIKADQPELLIGMLQNKISKGEAENIINQRPAEGFENIQDFWNETTLSSLPLDDQVKSSFKVKSDYFLLHAKAKVDDALFQMDSVLVRTKNNLMRVAVRQFGVQNDENNSRNNLPYNR